MVWHIFKKDWKLLWRFVVIVTAVQFASTAVLLRLGRFEFGENHTLMGLLGLLEAITILGSAILIVAVVHQDPIPGVRQDWLVRPVKRRDLLLAKFLFVLAAVHGPMLAADLLEGLANGFPIYQSLGAAASRDVHVLIGFSLPILAFASLTSGLTEAFVGGAAASLGIVAFEMFWALHYGRSNSWQFDPTWGSGVAWVTDSARLTLALLGASAVLGLQYFRRKTVPARWLTGGVAFLCLLTQLVPWRSAFAVQQWLSPSPGAGSSVRMSFEPSLGRFRSPSRLNFSNMTVQGNRAFIMRSGDGMMFLPLHITGLSSDVVLKSDLSEVRLIGADGKTVYRGPGNALAFRKEGSSDGEERTHQGILVPAGVYNRINDQTVRLEIDYSLTLFRLADSRAMPALGGDQRIPGVGWCGTKANDAGTAIQLRCLQAGRVAECGTLVLEHVPSGRRNPVMFACHTDYAPYFRQYVPDAMDRIGGDSPFWDPTGLARYPVDGPQLPESQLVMRIYQPQDHFTRHLVIPEIRLKDWEAQ